VQAGATAQRLLLAQHIEEGCMRDDAVAAHDGDSGISVALPRQCDGLVPYQGKNRQYGRAETIAAVRAIGAAWAAHHPGGPRIGVGDISLRGGGGMEPRYSHRQGVDVDLRPMRNDGQEGNTDWNANSYSQELTQALVDIIAANSPLPIQYIFFNDPDIRGVKPWPGHDDHLHVRFIVK
jgi:murein endopeptidase